VGVLHEALLGQGHESLVVTAGRTSTRTVRRISQRPLGWFLKTALWARRAAKYDVVHCHGGEALPLLLVLTLLPKKARILTTFHGSYAGIGNAFRPYSLEGRAFARDWDSFVYRTAVSWGHRLIDWLTVRLSDEVNTISEALAQEVFGAEKGKHSRIIYYGLPNLPPAETDPAIKRVALFYAGAPGHRKRVNALPLILEHVREEVPNATLRIAGFDLDTQPELKSLFEERGLLPAVDCIGFQRSQDLPRYYRATDVVVIPSAYESMCRIKLEAMQCGTPVVATRAFGLADGIEDGKNGFLVHLDRPREMAKRCVEIILNPALRLRLGSAARKTFEARFRLEREVDEYVGLYEALLGSAGKDKGKAS